MWSQGAVIQHLQKQLTEEWSKADVDVIFTTKQPRVSKTDVTPFSLANVADRFTRGSREHFARGCCAVPDIAWLRQGSVE